MKNGDRWGSYPIIGSGEPKGSRRIESLLKVSLRDTGEETGVIHKFAEDRYIAFAYARGPDGARGGLQPVKECSSFHDAAEALRHDWRSRMGERSRHARS